MTRKLFIAIVVICMTSCTMPTPLYYWGKASGGVSSYENLSYKRYDKESPKVICMAMAMYEDLLAHPGGTRQVPPPGICAEYAHMLLQADILDIFDEYATKEQKKQFENSPYGSDPYLKAMKLFEKEIETYPESAQFITPLLTKFKK